MLEVWSTILKLPELVESSPYFFADPPEVNRDQVGGDERQRDAMEDVETQQRRRAHQQKRGDVDGMRQRHVRAGPKERPQRPGDAGTDGLEQQEEECQ